MIPQTRSRLTIVIVFLALQISIFILELLIFTSITSHSWYIPVRQWFSPIGIVLPGVVLVSILFTGLGSKLHDRGSQCSVNVEADVASGGVRIAVWAQVAVLLIISVLGNFHSKSTSAKEIEIGLVLTHISLAIAILVQANHGTLTLADAMIGSMVLDA